MAHCPHDQQSRNSRLPPPSSHQEETTKMHVERAEQYRLLVSRAVTQRLDSPSLSPSSSSSSSSSSSCNKITDDTNNSTRDAQWELQDRQISLANIRRQLDEWGILWGT
ncbi:uncharacterized protein SETTUDRAFT_36738 [Exserohilum turcica Et28A]|uniref:Uncharacterized protein n=1 Tax=Exserohilum turcicum (strain 28A) TaxID=671987 RepID=R0KLV6_EXST2|nr:uncharacterized protein SETTUDRAFT_36738 [Exserohilum turcica Et28A]EOA90084.1 hypothetical protein SETTUDRAFT_36738 [Exserohilum turcica Et28A]